jgi:hypothetical protein
MSTPVTNHVRPLRRSPDVIWDIVDRVTALCNPSGGEVSELNATGAALAAL